MRPAEILFAPIVYFEVFFLFLYIARNFRGKKRNFSGESFWAIN